MDSLEVVMDASGDSGVVGVSSVGSYPDRVITPNDSGNQSIGTTSLGHAPLSPPRSAQRSVPSSPGSGSVNRREATPSNHSPLPTLRTPNLEYGNDGVLFGLQQLELQQASMEQQQASMEQRRQYAPDPRLNQGYLPTQEERNGGFASSDDDHTEPSSATGNTAENPAGYTRSDVESTSKFGRIIQSTRRRMMSGDRKRSGSADDGEDMLEGALIYGYLQKLGRNGKWQTRWFETDGECLTYYKSKQRIKLLATLDLAKVGSIVINHEDRTGCCFNINISARPYLLRADTNATCKDWVITLNRVKEARMQEGNVKLFMPDKNQPPDLLDHNYTPRVVVVANRNRTRAVDDQEIHSWEAVGWNENPANEGDHYVAPPSSSRLARWQKPRTSISRLAGKLVKWARSLRKHGCADADNHVLLDLHVHPPGHDDKPKRFGTTSPDGRDTVINSETGHAEPVSTNAKHSMDAADSLGHSASPSTDQEDEEEETRVLS